MTVDQVTFEQATSATTTFILRWPDVEVVTAATMDVAITAESLEVTIELTARESGEAGYSTLATRRWAETLRRI